MKTKIITNLKSRILLVDGIEPEATHIRLIKFIKHFQVTYDLPKEDNYNVGGGFRLDFKDFGGRDKYPNNLTFLGKLKDLTDDDCEELVETTDGMSKDYVGGLYIFSTKESFLSALVAEGVLFENPLKLLDDWTGIEKFPLSVKRQWQEAEQNVFSENSLVFVEQ